MKQFFPQFGPSKRALHNLPKPPNIVVLKERRLRRELKDFDFPSVLFEEKVLRFVQDDKIAQLVGYAKVSPPKVSDTGRVA